MCGIFGYAGSNQNAFKIIHTGLKRLDYRGYDSWGIAVVQKSQPKVDPPLAEKISVKKQVGKIPEKIIGFPKSSIGIGHTRWATHGAVTQLNAHPHFATDKTFVLAQNGIVENHAELKDALKQKGYAFYTETDTEVIVRLIENIKKTGVSSLIEGVRQAFLRLEGRNTIIVLTATGQIIAARNGSPLVIGRKNGQGDIYFSSDTLSFAHLTDHMLVVDNGQLISFINNKLQLIDIISGKEVALRDEPIQITDSKVSKAGYPHFMLKEINEIPEVIHQVIKHDVQKLEKFATKLKKSRMVYTIGSGTTGGAAAQIAYYLRVYARIPAVSLIGAEAKEYIELIGKEDVVIAPSQSGETADVLEVLEPLKRKGVTIASYINMVGSMMTRMSDYKFMAEAGPEICVMSTKVYVSMISWGYLLAKILVGQGNQARENLAQLAQTIAHSLKDQVLQSEIKKLAGKLAKKQHIFLLGKGQNLQIIKEAMIKIIEGAYIHAHAIAAGDLKHYAITLMEKDVPVIFAVANDEVRQDVLNSVSEVKARGATVIGVGPERLPQFDEYLYSPDTGETSAISTIIPLQLLAYHMAVLLGHDVDKPRNIAKSVTVK